MAVFDASREAIAIAQLFNDLHFVVNKPVLHCNSQAALAI